MPTDRNGLAGDAGRLAFVATDIEIEISAAAAAEAQGADGKNLTVGARKLLDILRALPEGAEVDSAIERPLSAPSPLLLLLAEDGREREGRLLHGEHGLARMGEAVFAAIARAYVGRPASRNIPVRRIDATWSKLLRRPLTQTVTLDCRERIST